VLYFTLYYLLTGLHALHVTTGVIVLGWLAWKARRGDFTPESHVRSSAAACTGASSTSCGSFCGHFYI
jgi:heme/copper-type cytochrome/quinol oxidase subunit 3